MMLQKYLNKQFFTLKRFIFAMLAGFWGVIIVALFISILCVFGITPSSYGVSSSIDFTITITSSPFFETGCFLFPAVLYLLCVAKFRRSKE